MYSSNGSSQACEGQRGDHVGIDMEEVEFGDFDKAVSPSALRDFRKVLIFLDAAQGVMPGQVARIP